jgi:hypothetical protein
MRERGRVRLAVVLVATATLWSMAPHGVGGAATTNEGPPRFVTRCTYSHRASNDPIVYFARPGASHTHDFFGNRTTNAFTTYNTLRRSSSTTCHNTLDRSAYWTPSLKVDGAFVKPVGISAYYSSNGKPYQDVQPPPNGLKVVAGSAAATAPQGIDTTSWSCADDSVTASSTAPTCPLGTLILHVNFPDCWDGFRRDAADHRSHLAYHGKNGVCPPTHSVPIPRLRLNVLYPTTGGPSTELASKGQYSGHADFFNAWDPKELRRLVTKCINAGISCDVNA